MKTEIDDTNRERLVPENDIDVAILESMSDGQIARCMELGLIDSGCVCGVGPNGRWSVSWKDKSGTCRAKAGIYEVVKDYYERDDGTQSLVRTRIHHVVDHAPAMKFDWPTLENVLRKLQLQETK